ncbi:MAG: hypothetical protein R3F59_32265 [Myxococcota bacterium]
MTLLPLLLAALGCHESDWCPEGQIRDGGDACVRYEPGEPEPLVDGVRFENGVTWQWQITGKVDTSHDCRSTTSTCST